MGGQGTEQTPRSARLDEAQLLRAAQEKTGLRDWGTDLSFRKGLSVLIEAAAITVDHDYRYFEIVGTEGMSANSSGLPTIRPGADVTIKVFGAGEVDPRPPVIWDAQAIGAGELP